MWGWKGLLQQNHQTSGQRDALSLRSNHFYDFPNAGLVRLSLVLHKDLWYQRHALGFFIWWVVSAFLYSSTAPKYGVRGTVYSPYNDPMMVPGRACCTQSKTHTKTLFIFLTLTPRNQTPKYLVYTFPQGPPGLLQLFSWLTYRASISPWGWGRELSRKGPEANRRQPLLGKICRNKMLI